jgi:hypothetical protein
MRQKKPFTAAQLAERFNLIAQHGIDEIDIWDMPVPQAWLPLLEKFLQQQS